MKGGLNQAMFLFRLRLVFSDHSSWYLSASVWPLFCSAVSYSCYVSRNASLLLDRVLRRLEITSGMFLRTFLGWLDLVLM